MLKSLIYYQELIKQGTQNDMKLVNVNIDLMQVFVTINKGGAMINADVENWLTDKYMIKDLFETHVIVNMNVINHVMLENI